MIVQSWLYYVFSSEQLQLALPEENWNFLGILPLRYEDTKQLSRAISKFNNNHKYLYNVTANDLWN